MDPVRAGRAETVRALDNIKVASAFPDAVGNSGTPERLAAMEALRNPVTYARDRAIGKAIRYLADRGGPPPMATKAP